MDALFDAFIISILYAIASFGSHDVTYNFYFREKEKETFPVKKGNGLWSKISLCAWLLLFEAIGFLLAFKLTRLIVPAIKSRTELLCYFGLLITIFTVCSLLLLLFSHLGKKKALSD